MTTPQGYYDLLERMERPGCAVCALLLQVSGRFVESLLYEFSRDIGTQHAFRAGRGLCNHHSWQLARRHGYSLGVAALFEAALDEVVTMLENEPDDSLAVRFARPFGGDGSSALANRLEPEGPCLVCASVRDAEKAYLDTLARYWQNEELQAACRRSDGLCLPHLRGVLRQMPSRDARRQLAQLHAEKWAALIRELDQFQVKSAFNYAGEPMGAEADSWKRAVAALAGLDAAPPILTRPE